MPAEQQRGDLVQRGAAFVEVARAAQVIHDRQGVSLIPASEADGVRDPDASLVLPAVLVAGIVVAARSPHTPLFDRADPSHPVHDVVPVVGREVVEHVVHQVVEVARGAVHEAPVRRAAGEVRAAHAEALDALQETAVLVGEPQLVAGRIVAVVEDLVDQAPVAGAEGEAAGDVYAASDR